MSIGTTRPETPLKRILREEGRVHKWVAQRAGIDEATFSRYVNGLHVPDDKRALIAEALGRGTDDLFGEDVAA